ncbi:MAG TPA: hypothetical protein VMV94_00345, partial [Phycisphaerae bacterium]|nr:hypothetical protein [Phycisphaerae bacterium]
NDVAGVTITESDSSTDVTEGGTTDTYTVVLTSQPIADVTVGISADGNTTLSPTTLLFTSLNWSVPQTVSVTAADDFVAQGPRSSTISHSAASADTSYSGIVIASVTASVTDNDVAGVTIIESDGSTDVTEGGATDTYTVVLNSQPTATVTITVGTDGPCTASPTLLTFDGTSWNIPHTVTVTAADDAIAQGPHTGTVSHTAASVDSNYNGIPLASVTALIADNDTAGVTIAESGGSTDVSESGLSDAYTIVLNSQPTADVYVTITPDAQLSVGLGGGVARTFNFNAANWNSPRTITVSAIDDDTAQGYRSALIIHSVASADPGYGGIGAADVTAHISDDDTAGVMIVESGGTTQVSEGGATDSYAIVLDSLPTADVTITAMPDGQINLGAGAGAPVTLNILAADWNTPHVITVSAYDDAVYEGTRCATITHSAVSFDPVYNGISVPGVTVTITDNDPPPPPEYAITRQVVPASSGDIDLQPSLLQYAAGATVTLTAVPRGSYVFDHWEGDLTGTANPASLSVSRALSVTAVFADPTAGMTACGPTELHLSSISLTADLSLVLDQVPQQMPGLTGRVAAAPIRQTPGEPGYFTLPLSVDVTVACLPPDISGQLIIDMRLAADSLPSSFLRPGTSVEVYRGVGSGWKLLPSSRAAAAPALIEADGRLHLRVVESLRELTGGGGGGRGDMELALEYVIASAPSRTGGTEPTDDLVIVTTRTRYGFCGLLGAAPLILLPLALARLKIRRRPAR